MFDCLRLAIKAAIVVEGTSTLYQLQNGKCIQKKSICSGHQGISSITWQETLFEKEKSHNMECSDASPNDPKC